MHFFSPKSWLIFLHAWHWGRYSFLYSDHRFCTNQNLFDLGQYVRYLLCLTIVRYINEMKVYHHVNWQARWKKISFWPQWNSLFLRKNCERNCPKYAVLSVKLRGKTIRILGSIIVHMYGVELFIELNEIINNKDYFQILPNYVKKIWRKMYDHDNKDWGTLNWIFLFDRDRKNTSKIVTEWFMESEGMCQN